MHYVDRDGKDRRSLADGLLATVLQHEIDHLDGVLFIDYLSKLKRDRVVKKFAKIARTRHVAGRDLADRRTSSRSDFATRTRLRPVVPDAETRILRGRVP